ncbi:MAG: DNA primase [Candidatus Omnitrophica bacterium]|nr:DNA primase [Candidatus Omnitrophota bacterium]
MGKVSQVIIDQVLDRTDIIALISDYVQLKKTGRSYKACCPFHNEKTPSFIVSPEKQIYHCFGCGEGGNAIGFLIKHENMSFVEALKMLAAKANVDIPDTYERREPGAENATTLLYEINKTAADFYHETLLANAGKTALAYLLKRGLQQDTIKKFNIGYAPESWDSIKNILHKKKFSIDLVRKSGLIVKSEKSDNEYDRFRNRIIFPIYNDHGKNVAFGARVMDNSLPKYINSPETPVYSKGNTLFALNFARKSIREAGYVILVEGYMDAVMPYQHGITNVVAVSGTALTEHQVLLLKRFTDTAVIIFDPDTAGQTASLRGLDIMIENDMFVRVATLPNGDDPDTYIKKCGKDAFLEIVKNAKDIFDYKLDILTAAIPGKAIQDKVKVSKEMLLTISKIKNSITRTEYLKKLSEKINVNENALISEVNKISKTSGNVLSVVDKPVATVFADPSSLKCKTSEKILLGMAVLDREAYEKIFLSIETGSFSQPEVPHLHEE